MASMDFDYRQRGQYEHYPVPTCSAYEAHNALPFTNYQVIQHVKASWQSWLNAHRLNGTAGNNKALRCPLARSFTGLSRFSITATPLGSRLGALPHDNLES